MVNTIINRIDKLEFDGRDSLEKLNVLSNVAIVFLRDRLKSYCITGEPEMLKCMAEINGILEKDYSGIVWGKDKFMCIKDDVLNSLEKLKPFYYDDPNNKPKSATFIDDEKKLSVENELKLNFLIVEQTNIDYLKERPSTSQYEEHERLNIHYVIFGGTEGKLSFLPESTLPEYIKAEVMSVFNHWKQTLTKY